MSERIELKPKKLSLSPITKQLFVLNQREINKVNATLLMITGIIGMIMFAGLLFLITVSKNDPHNPIFTGPLYIFIYGGMFIVCAGIVIYCRIISERHPALILPLYYLIFIALFFYGISNRFIAVPNGEVFTIELVMLMMPVILLDYTWRITLFQVLFLAVFCFLDCKYKGRLIRMAWRDDLVNMCISFVISLIGGYAIRSSRIQALENARIYILQRYTDELTTLANRRKLFHELRKSSDGRAAPIECLFIADLDFFKKYNDTFGHPAGDEVLRTIGKCFAEFGTQSGFEFFRYGGEEFAGLYRGEHEIDFADTIHSLCKRVRDLKIERALPDMPYVTISIGFAIASKAKPTGYEDFISMADNALYEAKSHGRNCAIEYTSAMIGNNDLPCATPCAKNQ